MPYSRSLEYSKFLAARSTLLLRRRHRTFSTSLPCDFTMTVSRRTWAAKCVRSRLQLCQSVLVTPTEPHARLRRYGYRLSVGAMLGVDKAGRRCQSVLFVGQCSQAMSKVLVVNC